MEIIGPIQFKTVVKERKLLFWDIETTGLDYTKDRITCIAMVDMEKSNPGWVFCHEDERLLLEAFLKTLKSFGDCRLYGWNVYKFDLPFVLARCMHHNLDAYFFLNECMHEDLKNVCPINPKEKRKLSLDEFAKFLGIKGKTLSGLDAVYLWEMRVFNYPDMIKMLEDYCLNDAKLVREIFEKIADLTMFDMEDDTNGGN